MHLTWFIDKSFVYAHNIPTVPTSVDSAIDDLALSSGAITEATIPLVLQVGAHHEVLMFYLITTPRHPIFLGLSWLETHDPTVDWCNYCHENLNMVSPGLEPRTL